jgi:hypothetical protein
VGTGIQDGGLIDLIDAIDVIPRLNTLSELCLRDIQIGNEGCHNLGKLSKNPLSGILHLDLAHNIIDDKGIYFLVIALSKHSTLKLFDLINLTLLTLEC